MLKKDFVRDGKRRIVASVTSGFSDTSAVVRDEKNEITVAPARGSAPLATGMAIWSQPIPPTPVF